MTRGARVREIAFDLGHRQVVVLLPEQHQDRSAGICARLGPRAVGAARIGCDVSREPRRPRPHRGTERLERGEMRHLAAEREADDADAVGGDPRVPGQEPQRGERVGHPGRQRRAGAGADDRGLAQAPRAEAVVGQRREPAPAELRRQPALVGLPEAADRVDHHHRRIPIPRLIGKAERRGDRYIRRRLPREDLTEVGIGARAERHLLDRARIADLTVHERRPDRDRGGHHPQRPRHAARRISSRPRPATAGVRPKRERSVAPAEKAAARISATVPIHGIRPTRAKTAPPRATVLTGVFS